MFAVDVVARLHRASGGLPPVLNNVATAIIDAATDNKGHVDDTCAKKAVAELTSD